MTELALSTTLTGEQREFLLTVKSSADRLLTIINEILDFSKMEAAKTVLDSVSRGFSYTSAQKISGTGRCHHSPGDGHCCSDECV